MCRKTGELEARRRRKAEAFRTEVGEIPAGEVGTEAEIVRLLWAAARTGSVPAMRIVLAELRRDPGVNVPSLGTIIDELAAKRARS